MIIKGCVQWNSVYGREDFSSSEDQTRSARSVGQCLPHQATGASGVSRYLKEKLFIVQLIVFKCLQLSLNAPWYTSMFFFFFFFFVLFCRFYYFYFFFKERQIESIIGLRCRQRNRNLRINIYCRKRGLPSFRHYPLTRGLGFLGLH